MNSRVTTTAPSDAKVGRAGVARQSAGVRPERSPLRLWVALASGVSLASGCGAPDDARTQTALSPSAPPEAASTGTLSIPLVTAESGLYRLRHAVLEVARSGVALLTLDSEAAPGAEALIVELDPGRYQIRLLDGWALEQLDAAGLASPVRAALISSNPVSVDVHDARVSTVAFVFTASSGVVALGQGAISVRVGVADPASLGACDAANQAGCSSGQHCLLADSGARSFCATPGQLPLGAACGSEQCVFGAQCLSVDPEAPGGSVCTALCNPLSPPFGCDCRGLGADGGAGVCGPPPPGTCELLDPSSCPAGQACQYPGGSFGVCGAPGTAAEGAPCFGEECQAGLDCFGDDAVLGFPGTCYRFCDLLAPACEFCFAVGTGNVGRCFL